MPATEPSPGPLRGSVVRLDQLRLDDAADLLPCFDDPRVYAQGYLMHDRPRTLEQMTALLRRRFLPPRSPGHLAYAVRLVGDDPLGSAGTVVGTTSVHDVHLVNESAHIGSTLYGPRWWGTTVNAQTKLLLLTHLFKECGFGRVKIQTDALNTRSAAAIAGLGATREGVLRREQRRDDGTWRDTVVFSILATEWPAVRDGLRARVARAQRSGDDPAGPAPDGVSDPG